MDVCVTVPKSFGLQTWIEEGDPAGEPWSGQLWAYYLGSVPSIEPGERVYVVFNGKLRGYAPLIQLKVRNTNKHVALSPDRPRAKCALVRGGDAVAVTIEEKITGFRGFRYRFWDRGIEIPFPDWKTE